MLTTNTTLPLLVNLALHYPQAGRTPAQLQILAEDWAEDLACFPVAVVAEAARQHRRESAFFPTVAEIRSRCENVQRGRQALAAALALPGQTRTLDEQCALNLEQGRRILARLGQLKGGEAAR